MTPKELVRVWFQNIDQAKFEELKNLMASDHRFHNPMTPEPVGPTEHVGMMQQMTESFDGQHHVDLLVEEDAWVAAYGRWSGKHIGEFNGVSATGKEVQFTWANFFQVVDGKVAAEHLETNPMSIMAQIGAVETENV